MAVALRLVLEGARAEGGLLVRGEILRCGTKRLGWEHGPVHHGELVGIGLELGAVRLHLLAGELLVEEHVPNTVLCRNVVVKLAVEQPGRGLQMGIQALVLGGQVIVLLLVHLLVDNILLGDAQCSSRPLLMDLGSTTGRLYAGLQTAVASPRCSDVGTTARQTWMQSEGNGAIHTALGSPHGCAPS